MTSTDVDSIDSTTAKPDSVPEPAKPKPRLGSLRALWPFVRRHTGKS